MPMDPSNVRTFHRALYGKILESVTLRKRGDDSMESVFTDHRLYECRWSRIFKQGEPIQKDMSSDHRRVLHIPRIQLDRVGVHYINAIDIFIDKDGRWWQPESTTLIEVKLMEQHICVACLRIDPTISEGDT